MTTRPIGITMGDPAGIGPELIGRAWQATRNATRSSLVAIGDPALFEARFDQCGIDIPVHVVSDVSEIGQVPADALPILATKANTGSVTPGVPSPETAAATIEAIERAVNLVHGGQLSAIVTAPIAKDVLYKAGFVFPGHTEFLGALADRLWSGSHHPVMALVCDELRVVPVTVHIPLSAVPEHLTTKLIVTTAQITAQDLQSKFGIAQPRLAIAGLNPHAGEGGAMGREDIEVIQPAIEQLCAEGIDATGPHPADTLFHAEARNRYDAVLAMYHDQALIPVKTLAFDDAVNTTLGLPFIRTSPDHGTAFDIAGKGVARPDSLIAAIRLADQQANAAP